MFDYKEQGPHTLHSSPQIGTSGSPFSKSIDISFKHNDSLYLLKSGYKQNKMSWTMSTMLWNLLVPNLRYFDKVPKKGLIHVCVCVFVCVCEKFGKKALLLTLFNRFCTIVCVSLFDTKILNKFYVKEIIIVKCICFLWM